MLTRTLRQARAVPRQVSVLQHLARARQEHTSAAVHPNIPEGTKKHSHELTISEPTEVVTADIVSGAPVELRHRQVRIFKPTRSTTQSGGSKGNIWRIDFDTLLGGGRWENPLMGWASSADYNQALSLKFTTMEDAIRFAEKQGWEYYVQQPKLKRIPPKNYSENYVYVPGKLRIAHTK